MFMEGPRNFLFSECWIDSLCSDMSAPKCLNYFVWHLLAAPDFNFGLGYGRRIIRRQRRRLTIDEGEYHTGDVVLCRRRQLADCGNGPLKELGWSVHDHAPWIGSLRAPANN